MILKIILYLKIDKLNKLMKNLNRINSKIINKYQIKKNILNKLYCN